MKCDPNNKPFVDSGEDWLILEDKQNVLETNSHLHEGNEVQITTVGALGEMKRQRFLS
ncbi:hypothetical protein [Paenibacillus anaericanus]|uniref:hypothetical protein n=1 Tax=Paenibacillus anaericanus TaxID=170367 RepID=UPI00147747D2|nr:hypothetical protein [Paenibacillus anaericanus]